MRSAPFVLGAALAMPVAAQASAFHVAVHCDGAMPVAMDVTAMRAGMTRITVEELMAFCTLHAPSEPKPVPQRLRST